MPSSAFQTCARSEEHTSELQSHDNLVCRLLLEKKKTHGRRGETRVERAHTPTHTVRVRCYSIVRSEMYRCCAEDTREDLRRSSLFFFFNDPAPPEIYTLSLHGALPICAIGLALLAATALIVRPDAQQQGSTPARDRKSTRLNSSHTIISYAVFCLK